MLLYSFAQQNPETAKQNIQKILATYFNSIFKKDSATFCGLFAMDSVSFYGVNSPGTYQGLLKQYPKAGFIMKDNHKGFIHFVTSSKKKAEEKYRNVHIWHDNTEATIFFNYGFWIDGKETNWGMETWQLIINGKEWKIMSALFSINDPRLTPDPDERG
ncbi:MAG TPA: hypothetical protein VKR53_16935 [Puia sp.]|nr:hypothetical protein [Puia sp.]